MEQETEITTNRNAEIISTIAYLLAVATAIFLRFYWLELKPLHHDEGVNSYFLLNLANRWDYKYDPTNYHGPSLYYFVLLLVKTLGQSDFALRAFPALCGVLTVVWMWGLRHGLGLVGMPVAAWSLALSPGLVYYSRDFIHESSFGFFTVGMIVTAYHWRQKYSLIWCAVFTGLLFVTKETSIHTVIVLLLSVICALGWDLIRKAMKGERISWAAIQNTEELKIFRLGWIPFLRLVGIFLAIYILFYTSFFTNLQGPIDFLRSVLMWTGRGVKEGIHDHARSYYLGILIKLELPLVIAAIIGIIVTFQTMGKTGQGGLGQVAGGIAEALIMTAFGLMVAIPAVWIYNYLNGRIEDLQIDVDTIKAEIIDFLARPEKQDGSAKQVQRS